MSIISGGGAVVGAGGAAGGYEIERSLRFNSADSAYLSRTFGTPTNNLKWTMSMWLKRGELTVPHMLFCSPISGSSNFAVWFSASGGSGSGDFINYHIPNTGLRPFITNAVYRDSSAWYHFVFVFDSANATQADRFILYVNGERQSASTASVDLNQACKFNQSGAVGAIGGGGDGFYGTKSDYFDGYLTEINFIDGQALTPTDFGEYNEDTGVWQPIEYTGSYGNNGFYLNFSNNSSTTTLGNDSSGNGNNWTTNNFSVTAGAGNDSLVDTPTPYGTDTGAGGEVRGNYATWNPLDKGGDITLSNGNLDYTGSASIDGWRAVRSTVGLTSGKWRFSCAGTVGFSSRMNFGIARSTSDVAGYFTSQNIGIQYAPYDALLYVDGSTSSYGGGTYRSTYTFDCFIDCDNKKIWFAVNGTVLGSGDPNTGANPAATWSYSDPVFPVTQCYGGNWNSNFGQRPFDFTVSSASTFKALVTTNLPEPTIEDGEDYFNTVLWTGTGSGQSITGMGFQPDWLWFKSRNNSDNHALMDVVRGATKGLSSNSTAAEVTSSAGQDLVSFDADGFTTGTPTNYSSLGSNGYTIVTWGWKANGAGSTNTAGTITSTVSVNTTSGFSIITYTGNNTSGATVGHGLGVKPSFIIVKKRTGTDGWGIYHTSLGATKTMELNTTGAEATSAIPWNNTEPTSSVIYLNGNNYANSSSFTYIMYAFAPVAAYSAFGSYVGNGSTDGVFVYTNFRPRWILLKNATTGGPGYDWFLYDSARDTYNVSVKELEPNLSASEDQYGTSTTGVDLLSNGFKMRTSGVGFNGSGSTYIYAAFAENPFKYALAR